MTEDGRTLAQLLHECGEAIDAADPSAQWPDSAREAFGAEWLGLAGVAVSGRPPEPGTQVAMLRKALERTLAAISRAQALLETLVSREGVGMDAAERIPHAQIILLGAVNDLCTRAALAATDDGGVSGRAPTEPTDELLIAAHAALRATEEWSAGFPLGNGQDEVAAEDVYAKCREALRFFEVQEVSREAAPRDAKRLDEIEARLKAATPGPWALDVSSDRVAIGPQTGTHDPYDGGLPIVARPVIKSYRGDYSMADAELIADAPEDLRYLLALVRGSRDAEIPQHLP